MDVAYVSNKTNTNSDMIDTCKRQNSHTCMKLYETEIHMCAE